MVRVTQGILGLKRNRLVEYFWDCPDLVMAIEKKKLKEINEVYNFYLERSLKGSGRRLTAQANTLYRISIQAIRSRLNQAATGIFLFLKSRERVK